MTAGPGLTGGGSAGNVTLALSMPISPADGGTGATTPAAALANLGAQAALPGVTSDSSNGINVAGKVVAGTTFSAGNGLNEVNVKAEGAVGDGTTNDYPAILAAITAASTNNCAYFPPGSYAIGTPLTITTKTCMNFAPGAALKYIGTSTTNVLTIEEPTGLRGISVILNNISIDGNGLATNGIYGYTLVGFKIENPSVRNVKDTGIVLDNSILGTIVNPVVSVAEPHTIMPVNGIVLGPKHTDTTLTIITPRIEGVSGVGIKVIRASNTTIIGGTSEGNGIGIETDSPSTQTLIEGIDLENNSTDDVLSTTQTTTMSEVSSSSTNGVVLSGFAAWNSIRGSNIKNISLGSTVFATTLTNVIAGQITDLSIGPVYINVTTIGKGTLSSFPSLTVTGALTAKVLPPTGTNVAGSNVGNAGSGPFSRLEDLGTCAMSSGACEVITLNHTYTSAPVCVATWTGTGTLTGNIKASTTTNTLTISSTVNTDTALVGYSCFSK